MRLLDELKRRNVIRMAGLYIVSAWLVVQVAETLLSAFDIPAWVLRAIILVLALGFVPALLFSWVYELTPGGLKRERDVDRSSSIVDRTARKLDVAVIILLLLVGALLLWSRFHGAPPSENRAVADVVAVAGKPGDAKDAVSEKSIAVLPFADFSQDKDQGWFADGLAEEILNSLARTPDLLVSARTSSFKYKDSALAIPQIAAELGVANVLEGSVRSGAGRVRVTAQLIRASDGFHLWSQTFDRDDADVIGIQEDLARQIATAMQTSMDPNALADMAQVGTRSVEAYQAYLRGVADAASTSDADAFRKAYEYFEKARMLDPAFAAAHARAANYWLTQLDPTLTTTAGQGVPPEVARRNFQERNDLAIRHATRDIDRMISRALMAQLDLRFRDAIDLHRKILAERPLDRDTLSYLLDLLTRSSEIDAMREPLDRVWSQAFERPEMANLQLNYGYRGPDRKRAADQALELAQRWQDDESNLYQAQRALLWDGRVEDARKVFDRWRQVSRQSLWASLPHARQASAEGRCSEVERILRALEPGDVAQRWHIQMMLGNRAAADEVLMPFERSGNVQALAGFLSYPHFDPSPFPSLMRILDREKIRRGPAEALPFACHPKEAIA